MFTAKPQKNRTAATEYFDEHLSQNDYYSQGQTQAGYWVGEGAERLADRLEHRADRFLVHGPLGRAAFDVRGCGGRR